MRTERDALDALVSRVALRGDIDQIRRRGDRLRWRRRFAVSGVACLLLLALAGLAVAATGATNDDSQTVIVDPPTTTTAVDLQKGPWIKITGSSLSGRQYSVVATTANELLVWSGLDGLPDGKVYDTSTAAWRTISPSPAELTAGSEALVSQFTDHELVVVSGELFVEARAAAYEPASDSWRMLTAPPFTMREGFFTAWTGREVLFFGGGAGDGVEPPNQMGYAYEPAHDSWRSIPAFPLGYRAGPATTWYRGELLVLGGSAVTSSIEPYNPQRDGAAYNPETDRWRTLPADPFGNPRAAYAIGGGVVVIDDRCDDECTSAAFFDPVAGTWTDVAKGPPLDRRLLVRLRFGLMGLSDGVGAVITPDIDAWHMIEPPPFDISPSDRWAIASSWDDIFLVGSSVIWRYQPNLDRSGIDAQPSPEDQQAATDAARLVSEAGHQRDRETFEKLPLAEIVMFFRGTTILGGQQASHLRDEAGWRFEQSSSTVSIMDLLRDSNATTVSTERSAPCHDVPDDPPGTASMTRVTISRSDAPSCDTWWAIDLYLQDGRITFVRLDR